MSQVVRSRRASGAQLVFLHAFPLNAAMWNQQKAIAKESICPNLYSLGTSLEDWAASVLALTNREEPIIAIGSSMGGSCAIEMARQSPSRVAGLVLVGAKAGHDPEPNVRDAYIEKLRAHGIRGIWPEVSSWFSSTTPKSVVDSAFAIANQQHTDDLVNAVRVFHGRPDLEYVLRNWQKPYLVISGEQDPMFSRAKSERISKLGPNGNFRLMTNCGHFMNLERPEAFNQIIREFTA